MDAFGGAGGAQNPIETWFYDTPVVTRWLTVSNAVLGVLVTCKIVTPFQLFYSFRAVFVKDQYWRLLTTFLYVSPVGLDLVFHIFFMQRYARLLEESTGRSPAHFSWLLLYAATALLTFSPLINVPFLAHCLSTTLVYIWARRNPDARMSFLGLMTFTAPFLPWVLIGFNIALHGNIPKDDLLGVAVGHVYYFLSDVYPAYKPGSRPMDPPRWWCAMFEGRQEPAVDITVGNGTLQPRDE